MNKYHFIGIGGVSMLALAKILMSTGHEVSGTDIRTLNLPNITTFIQDDYSHIPPGTNVVVYNTDIKPTNPEMIYAKENNIKLIHRCELLMDILNSYNTLTVGITGGSGKTSTTYYLHQMLMLLGQEPLISMVGERTLDNNDTIYIGKGQLCVVELNEADFLCAPHQVDVLIWTNFGLDHIWSFNNDLELFKTNYLELCRRAKCIIYNYDDEICREIVGQLDENYQTISFGMHENSHIRIMNYQESHFNSFDMVLGGKVNEAMHFETILLGKSNAFNLAAVLGFMEFYNNHTHGQNHTDFQTLMNLTKQIVPAKRRFETIFQNDRLHIIDDQALIYNEIENAFNSVLKYNQPVHGIIDPFRIVRVQTFQNEFLQVIEKFSSAVVLYPELVTNNSKYISTKEELWEYLDSITGICLLCFKGFQLRQWVEEWVKNVSD